MKRQLRSGSMPVRWRVWCVQLIFAVAALGLVARAIVLQVVEQKFLEDQGEQRHVRVVNVASHRGQILDRRGQPLAVSTPVDSLWANPKELAKNARPEALRLLAERLETSIEFIEQRLAQNSDREFVYLRRHVSPDQADLVMALQLSGVYRVREYRRYYPAGEITGHVVGFTDVDDNGLEGLELAYDQWLAGESGSKRVIQDRFGNVIENIENIETAEPGRDLVISLDLRIQYLAYRALKEAMAKTAAKSASLVVLDVNSGEILAIANQPGFNPNDRSQLDPDRYRNRAITDMFEPGSSVKPLVVAAALEAHTITSDSVINTAPGFWQVGSHTVRDEHNLGRIDLTHVLAKSSNVGMSKIALQLPAKDIWSVLSQLGIGQLTGSGFPGESAGVLHSYIYWQPIHQATLSYGYGLSVTLVQLARAYAAIAAGGMSYPLSLVALDHAPVGERVLSAATAQTLVSMLESVVSEEGTGYRARVVGYRVAGKTGTAHKVGRDGYDQDRYTAIFAGMAPASAPVIALVVLINEPQGDAYYGGEVAAPVFAEVMAGTLRLLAVSPDQLPELNPRAAQAKPILAANTGVRGGQ